MTAIRLEENLRGILKAVQDASITLQSTDGEGYALPERQFITIGSAVYDEPQLAVASTTTNTGLASPDNNANNLLGPCQILWNTAYEVSIVLKACQLPTTTRRGTTVSPNVECIEADAANISRMTDVLVRAIEDLNDSGVLGRMQASITYGDTEGGMVAVIANITANSWL